MPSSDPLGLIVDEVARMQKLIAHDEHLMGSLLEAWDNSEGDTVQQIIDVKIRRRMERV